MTKNISYINENKIKAKEVARSVIAYVFLGLWAIFVLFPFYWMILTSFKTLASYNSEVNPKFFTTSPTFENYKTAITSVNLLKYMLNTTVFALITTIIMIVVVMMAAFAFARLEFKGKNLLFTGFLSLMMIPNELIVITNYVTIMNLHWNNTFRGLILPSIMSIFYIYLLRQNFMQVPDELYFAAKVDGTSDFKYLWKVLIPLSAPTIVSIMILKLIECWNSYVWPRLITTNEKYYLVSNAIQIIKSSGFGRDNIPAMMAAVCLVSAPLLILFVIFRKQIMSGVSRTGTKG